jgi:Fic family protein
MSKQSVLEQIGLLQEELQKLTPISPENQEKLNKKFRLEFHYNTNHIEGNTLTYAETELLLIFDETRGSHTLREHEEMKGSDVALDLIRGLANEKERPLTESFIKNINQVLLVRPYFKEAITAEGQPTKRKILVGDYKKQPNSVLLDNGEIFSYSSPTETPNLMRALLEWFHAELAKNELHPLELASILHHKFVLIHPFDDGNGRISRLLLNYVLFHFNYPPIIVKSDDKINYLRSLRDADTGNMDSFTEYLGKQLIWSLELQIKATNNESIDELDDWKKNLKLLKRELDGSQEIKEKKSNASILNIINNEILPFGLKLDKELGDFSELFLSRAFYYTPTGTFEFQSLGTPATVEMIEKSYKNGFSFYLSFKEFKRKVDNPFTVGLSLSFVFDEYLYSIKLEGRQIFSNLYHQNISEQQSKETISNVASTLMLKIQEGIKEVKK